MRRGTWFALLGACVAIAQACSEDETSGTTSTGSGAAAQSATTTTGTGATGGSGATGGAAGNGGTAGQGGSAPLTCVEDDECTFRDACVCADCWDALPKCADPNGCLPDGTCTAGEGCQCDDCANEAQCDDFCVRCSTWLGVFPGYAAEQVCTTGMPSSAEILDAFLECACSPPCDGPCAVGCMGMAPPEECGTCINANCAPELQACSSDVKIHCLDNDRCEIGPENCTCVDCQTTALCVIDQCVDDGVCTLDDSCTCADCDSDPTCTAASCVDDGTCVSFSEGCVCVDCATNVNCLDNGTGGGGGAGGAGGN